MRITYRDNRLIRLWSLHPQYLDTRGLVALWREGLLAKHVLEGQTRGYRHHPQLERFKAQIDPVLAIHAYLTMVWKDAQRRGYAFDPRKITPPQTFPERIAVTEGQITYEWQHLCRKLQQRSPRDAQRLGTLSGPPLLHPLFIQVPGPVASWEKLSEAVVFPPNR